MCIPVVGRSPTIERRPALRSAGVAFVVALVAVLTTVELIPTRYSATSVVSFAPRPSAVTSADTVRLLGEKYVVLATSATIMQRVGDAIKARPDELITATTATLDATTGNLSVTVVRPDRQAAVDAANTIADALVRRSRFDELVAVETTSPASLGRTEVLPARGLLRAAGLVAAMIVGLLVWLLGRGRPTGRWPPRWPGGDRQDPRGAPERELLLAEGAR